jgi:hypothetical protein
MQTCGNTKAPDGWWCTRELGHEGPCAALPAPYLYEHGEPNPAPHYGVSVLEPVRRAIQTALQRMRILDRTYTPDPQVAIVHPKDAPELKAVLDQSDAAEQCKHTCPECGTRCSKKAGTAEAGYDGIAGLCWCKKCNDWWLAGEPTLLRNRRARTESAR